MAVETFIWSPRIGTSGKTKFAVLSAKFGDGYKQTAPDGISNVQRTWPLSFTGTEAEMRPIIDFLDGHAGSKAFLWAPPLGTQGFYSCEEYEVTALGAGMYSIAATFEWAYKP